ncbi:isocitrate lyase/PEP mutase family protein [Deinococcus hohokamensis]|uniref:Isocitrate lyase/phosphoenolpyruvate mutase family protein n=1 Tax=Deinococcus hohokamensis TaxID=309883 RepID=A0ABV9IC19_9DEIO
MTLFSQLHLIRTFRDLHQGGLLLPNAWDAASARMFEHSGFAAIGTTSAGIAYTRGRQDGQTLSRAEMRREVENIVAAVRVPVNADIEAGYGDSPAEVAQTVETFAAVGVCGVNLEDATGRASAPLYALDDQVRRLAAARRAADRAGGLYLNARTDTYLLGVGATAHDRLEETLRRGRAFLEAGADSLFVPGLTDLATVRTLRTELGRPLNLMGGPGAPSVPALHSAGASRVSLGQGVLVALLGQTARIARELRDTGTYGALQDEFYGFEAAEALFAR